MRQFTNHRIGIDQGDTILFSDFADEGPMWTGQGERERRLPVSFEKPFRSPPVVHLSVSLWDVDTEPAMRGELISENVTEDGFDIVFRTWLDSRFARMRVSWIAIGELPHEDDWDIE